MTYFTASKFRVIIVLHQIAFQVNEIEHRDPEFQLPSSDDGSGNKRLVPRKVLKQIDKEVPHSLIPSSQQPLCQAPLDKEWSEWKKWNGTRVLSLEESRQVEVDSF